jgi:hypothetical protein
MSCTVGRAFQKSGHGISRAARTAPRRRRAAGRQRAGARLGPALGRRGR